MYTERIWARRLLTNQKPFTQPKTTIVYGIVIFDETSDRGVLVCSIVGSNIFAETLFKKATPYLYFAAEHE